MPSEKSEPLVIDLTPKLLASMGGRQRKLGRYSASEIYKMITPGLPWGMPVGKFFDVEEITPENALRMSNGIMYHEMVQKHLDEKRNEIKREYYYYGPGDPRNFSRVIPPYPAKAPKLAEEPMFTLVGKADHVPEDDSVWEIKTSDTVMTKSKPWQDHQAKLYCTMFEKSVGYVLQPLIDGNKLVLKEVGRVKRDDEWFAKEMAKLQNYHERLILMKNG